MYVLIVAGGSGTRLWPASRKNSPKQLLEFMGKKTLLQDTFARLRKGFSEKEIFVATGARYFPQIQAQLPLIPQSRYSIEPQIKDRGPAIGLAALIMNHCDPLSNFVTAWSDHFIKNEKDYFKILKQAEKYLRLDPNIFITIGVPPAFAHTGLGYIKQGRPITNNLNLKIYRADAFKEKPSLKTAQKFLQNGSYLWNTGYFVCSTKHLLELYKKHLPDVFSLLMKIKPFIGGRGQQAAINKFYPQMPEVDIEHGLIEKLEKVAVLPANFGWVDIGSWKIIKEILSLPHENLTKGNVITHLAKGNLVYNYENKLVATVGLKDVIVINTKDALLVANKNDSEQVKELVNLLRKNKRLKKYL